MKKIQSFQNENLQAVRTAHIYMSDTLEGFQPTYEVSTHVAGVGVDWEFKTFKSLEDAQCAAIQHIMPLNFLCKYTGD